MSNGLVFPKTPCSLVTLMLAVLFSGTSINTALLQKAQMPKPTLQAETDLDQPGFAETVKDVSALSTHRLVLDNEEVRVFAVEIPSGKQSDMHWHEYDFLLIPLSDGEISETVIIPDKANKKALKARLVVYEHEKVHSKLMSINRTLMAHEVQNEAAEPYRVLEVEIKHGESKWVHGSRSGSGKTSLAPTETFSTSASNKNVLAVILEPCELSHQVGVQEPENKKYSLGDALWMGAGIPHKLTNLGSQPATLILVVLEQ